MYTGGPHHKGKKYIEHHENTNKGSDPNWGYYYLSFTHAQVSNLLKITRLGMMEPDWLSPEFLTILLCREISRALEQRVG